MLYEPSQKKRILSNKGRNECLERPGVSFGVSSYKPNLDFLSIKAGRKHCFPRTLRARTPLPDCLMLPEAFQSYKYRWKILGFAGSWLFPQADSLAWCWLLFWLLGSMNPFFCFTLWFLTWIFQNYLRGEGSWMPTSEKTQTVKRPVWFCQSHQCICWNCF